MWKLILMAWKDRPQKLVCNIPSKAWTSKNRQQWQKWCTCEIRLRPGEMLLFYSLWTLRPTKVGLKPVSFENIFYSSWIEHIEWYAYWTSTTVNVIIYETYRWSAYTDRSWLLKMLSIEKRYFAFLSKGWDVLVRFVLCCRLGSFSLFAKMSICSSIVSPVFTYSL